LFGDSVFHVYAPLDLPGAVRRFFERVQPRLLIIMETEIWPNLYHEAAARGIPILIANARISQRSIGGYRRLRKWTAVVLGQVSRIAAQTSGRPPPVEIDRPGASRLRQPEVRCPAAARPGRSGPGDPQVVGTAAPGAAGRQHARG
jgi:hypothetical protein